MNTKQIIMKEMKPTTLANLLLTRPSAIDVDFDPRRGAAFSSTVFDQTIIDQMLCRSLNYIDVQSLYMKNNVVYLSLIMYEIHEQTKPDFDYFFALLFSVVGFNGSKDSIEGILLSVPESCWNIQELRNTF